MSITLVRKRAILYLRISKDTRGEEAGVERQEFDGRAIADRRGWNIIAVIIDNDAPAKGHDDRAGWKRMFKMIRAGEADIVIGWDMTRVLRNGRDRVDMLELGKAHNLTISLIRGNDMDLGTSSGRFIADILGAQALQEIEQKSERQISANLQNVREGKEPTRRAFGYPGTDQRPGTTRKDQGPEKRAIQVPADVVAAEAAAVRDAFDAALAGDSILRIMRGLNATGLTTTRGTPWSRAGARALLLNPRYAGLRNYRGDIQGKGIWDPLVPEEQWRALASMLENPARTTNHRRSTARLHLLGGLALCGVCGDGTTVKTSYGGTARSVTGYRMYRCRSSGHLSRRADHIDDYVEEVMISWASSDEAAKYLVQKSGPDMAALRKDEATLTIRLDQLAEGFADGTLSEQQLRAGTVRARTRLAEVKQALKASESIGTLGDLIGPNSRQAWQSMNLDRRRKAISLVFTVTLVGRVNGARVSSRFDPDSVQVLRR